MSVLLAAAHVYIANRAMCPAVIPVTAEATAVFIVFPRVNHDNAALVDDDDLVIFVEPTKDCSLLVEFAV